MNIRLLSFVGMFLLLYGLLNYYIGLRGWQAFGEIAILRNLPPWGWILFMVFLAVLLPLGRLTAHLLPRKLARIIIYAGSYWMTIIYYLFLIVLVADIISFSYHWIKIIPPFLSKSPALSGIAVLLLVFATLIYGTWNANHPIIRNYNLSIDKKAANLNEMHIAVISDLHLGWIVGLDRMADMVEKINSLQPDLVILAGDIIDEGIDSSAERQIPAIMGALDPRFGTYAVLGNHEYISGNAPKAITCLNQAGVQVLRDQWIKVADQFYVIGRDDRSCKRYTGRERQQLPDIMSGIARDRLPIILIDHEPVDLETAKQEGVDMQFSGHTHLGQLFPNNYITGLLYEDDWGYLKKGNLQVIVSCGYGTWGPPIRVGNRPEIVNVSVRFTP